jgi:predicted DNA-binding protein with PD1-like motif
MRVLAIRLRPKQDLRQSLLAFAIEQQVQAGFILSAIGSLRPAAIRLANQPSASLLETDLELLTLSGTLSIDGLHLHLTVADATGQVIGGHLCDGSLIRTTAEIVIGIVPDVRFLRQPDAQTGYLELDIQPNLETSSVS